MFECGNNFCYHRRGEYRDSVFLLTSRNSEQNFQVSQFRKVRFYHAWHFVRIVSATDREYFSESYDSKAPKDIGPLVAPQNRAVSPAPNTYPTPKLTPRPGFCSLRVALNFPLMGDNHASN